MNVSDELGDCCSWAGLSPLGHGGSDSVAEEAPDVCMTRPLETNEFAVCAPVYYRFDVFNSGDTIITDRNIEIWGVLEGASGV